MSDNSRIEWTDATWNPVIGCRKVSPGCVNCYAERMARRLAGIPGTRDSYGAVVGEHGWNGAVRLVEHALEQPLRWTRPRRVFVCSMSDLFHGAIHFTVLDRVFAVMALCPQHTFQVLTKRAWQMWDYMQLLSADPEERLCRAAFELGGDDADCRMANALHGVLGEGYNTSWPLPNVWLGVSAEDQQRLDEQVPDLLNTPAAVRFVSLEPLLGPVDLTRVAFALERGLDWVIVGGESGPGARPLHPDWVRSVREQCVAAGVPFFFKQWGEWAPWHPELVHSVKIPVALIKTPGSAVQDEVYMARVGKRAAGRALDGVTWDEYPEVKP